MIVLHIAAVKDTKLEQMDVKNAYLNGVLEETIYMRQPKGYEVPGQERKLLKLKKGLYGLKQAGRVWNDMLDQFLLEQGFTRLRSDPCIYVRINNGCPLVIIVYVDNLVLGSPSRKEVGALKKVFKANFKMDDLGPLAYILGIRVVRDRAAHALYLVQDAYVERVLERFGMADCAPVSTPLPSGVSVFKHFS